MSIVKAIIIMGGRQYNKVLNTTEVLYTKDQKWTPGPPLPCNLVHASCVALPPITNFACIVIGGSNSSTYWDESQCSSNVYGLNNNLTEWTLLGRIRTERQFHLVLALS